VSEKEIEEWRVSRRMSIDDAARELPPAHVVWEDSDEDVRYAFVVVMASVHETTTVVYDGCFV
jgi:hypothetical protein